MRPLLASLIVLLAGCDTGQDCTDELVRITVQVVKPDGTPIKALRTTLTNTRNLDSFGLSAADSLGTYTVISDNNLSFVRRAGDVLTFEATDDTLIATAEFTIGREDCHVAKFDGPDRIVAQPIGTGG